MTDTISKKTIQESIKEDVKEMVKDEESGEEKEVIKSITKVIEKRLKLIPMPFWINWCGSRLKWKNSETSRQKRYFSLIAGEDLYTHPRGRKYRKNFWD